MPVKIVDNTVTIATKITNRSAIGLRAMLDDIHREANPGTPKDTGDLRNRVRKMVLGLKGVIEWRTKYAAIQEAKQFKNYTTPGTGPHFAKKAVHKVARNYKRYFQP